MFAIAIGAFFIYPRLSISSKATAPFDLIQRDRLSNLIQHSRLSDLIQHDRCSKYRKRYPNSNYRFI